PTSRLSGDQNGVSASSVPGSARASSVSRGRTQRERWPLRSTAVKATWRPSGEIASNFSREEKLAFGGGAMVSRSKAGLELVLCKVKNAPRPSVTKVSRPAAIHQGLGVAAGCGVSVAEI